MKVFKDTLAWLDNFNSEPSNSKGTVGITKFADIYDWEWNGNDAARVGEQKKLHGQSASMSEIVSSI